MTADRINMRYPWILFFITLCNAAAGTVFLCFLPARVAVHFNAAFLADKMGTRWWYLIGFLLPPLAAAGLLFETALRGERNRNARTLRVVFTFVTLLFAYLGWIMAGWCGGVETLGERAKLPLSLVICAPLGILCIVFGNYLPVVKRNKTFGIRTPATLSSDYVWKRTHQTMGKVFVGIGGAEIVCALIDTFAGWRFLALLWLAVSLAGTFIALPVLTGRFKKEEADKTAEGKNLRKPN